MIRTLGEDRRLREEDKVGDGVSSTEKMKKYVITTDKNLYGSINNLHIHMCVGPPLGVGVCI